jgi:hypothetical protein
VLSPDRPCEFTNSIIIFVSCANFGAKKQEQKNRQNPLSLLIKRRGAMKLGRKRLKARRPPGVSSDHTNTRERFCCCSKYNWARFILKSNLNFDKKNWSFKSLVVTKHCIVEHFDTSIKKICWNSLPTYLYKFTLLVNQKKKIRCQS